MSNSSLPSFQRARSIMIVLAIFMAFCANPSGLAGGEIEAGEAETARLLASLTAIERDWPTRPADADLAAKHLQAEDPAVAEQALKVLLRIGDKRLPDLLLARLATAGENKVLAESSARLLRRLTQEDHQVDPIAWQECLIRQVDALKERLAAIDVRLAKGKTADRLAAADDLLPLARQDPEAVATRLLELAKDADERVVDLALRGLATCGLYAPLVKREMGAAAVIEAVRSELQRRGVKVPPPPPKPAPVISAWQAAAYLVFFLALVGGVLTWVVLAGRRGAMDERRPATTRIANDGTRRIMRRR